jgi:hypothetical protein
MHDLRAFALLYAAFLAIAGGSCVYFHRELHHQDQAGLVSNAIAALPFAALDVAEGGLLFAFIVRRIAKWPGLYENPLPAANWVTIVSWPVSGCIVLLRIARLGGCGGS